MKKAFVVSFEQLPAFLLGCYGHPWIETPNFDRLASLSVVFDQHFANDLTTGDNSFPWWTGQTVPGKESADAAGADSFVSRLKDRGVHTTLLLETEDAAGRTPSMRAQEPFFAAFDQVETVSGNDGFEISEAETPFARLMQTAIEKLPDWMAQPADQLVWIRSAGVPQTPLSPEFYATLYLDEVLDQGSETDDDADDFTGELPAEPVLTDEDMAELEDEPDLREDEDWEELITAVTALFHSPEEWSELDDEERQMARAVFAGYVTLLDQWLGRFLDRLLEYAEQQSVLLIVTAARGSSELLGPAREVENWGLLEETTHVPLLIFDSENQQQGNRRQFLSQSADLPVTLSAWWGISPQDLKSEGTDLLALIAEQGEFTEPVIHAASDQAIAIRTPEFYYLKRKAEQSPAEEATHGLLEETSVQLYQKPTDRWDVYEQHTQHPETVAALSELLDEKQTGTTS
jgi:arylsulfatase A-like enzyme